MEWQFWLALIVMIVGIVGTVLPILPGLILIFGAALAYGIFDKFQHITPTVLVILGLLTIVGIALDYFAGVIGAKHYGASKYGTWGAIIGAVAGLFLFPFGLLIFPPLGVIIGEMLSGKQLEQAISSAWGTCLGMLGGAVAKIGIGVIMTGIFIWKAVQGIS